MDREERERVGDSGEERERERDSGEERRKVAAKEMIYCQADNVVTIALTICSYPLDILDWSTVLLAYAHQLTCMSIATLYDDDTVGTPTIMAPHTHARVIATSQDAVKVYKQV